MVSGRDRREYLQGLLTNDIAALTPGHGCYSAYLTPQGRMISDMWIYELGDVMLLSLPSRETKDVVLAKLDQFIFSEDVQLGDLTDGFGQLAIVGPAAVRVVAAALREPVERLAAMPEHGCARGSVDGGAAIITRISDIGEDGFDVYVEPQHIAEMRRLLAAEQIEDADAETVEALRIEAGIPAFHRDMDEETIPLEAGIESRAISMNKGCYVGQEVIVRVLHRGHGRVAKKLAGLLIDAHHVPPSGTTVTAGDHVIGKVTSAVRSIALDRPIALAYLSRDFLEPGTRVRVHSHDATVTRLPFLSHQQGH